MIENNLFNNNNFEKLIQENLILTNEIEEINNKLRQLFVQNLN